MSLYIYEREKEININRYKYTNEDLDITIIEILEDDAINDVKEIDEFMYSDNYTNLDIISISLNKDNDKEQDLLYGKITEKNNDNYMCNIESINEWIIILKDNKKLLGIMKEKDKKMNIIPMNIIKDKINYIKCKYQGSKSHVNNDDQIINYKDSDDNIINEKIEKEIKVIINGEIKSNRMEFKFEKEGEHIIYSVTDNLLTNMSYMFYKCSSKKK